MSQQSNFQGYGQPQYQLNQANGAQQMTPYGQQAVAPQPLQSPGAAQVAGRQQSSTTQSTTTSYITQSYQQQADQVQTPVQYQYQPAPQAIQFQNTQAQIGWQHQQQQAPPAIQYQVPAPQIVTSQVQQQSYEHLKQAPPQPAVQQQDYSHLKQAPPPQAVVQQQDYSHLKQAPPPQAAIQQQDYSHLKQAPPPLPPPPTAQSDNHASSQTVATSTTRQTLTYQGSTSGGQARQEADSRGEGQQFEQRVQTFIRSLAICPGQYQWYHVERCYICAGGNHAIEFEEIDKWSKDPAHRPRVRLVNTFLDPNAPIDPRTEAFGAPMVTSMHPPEVDPWQPMHLTHRQFILDAIRANYWPSDEAGRCRCHAELGIGTLAEKEEKEKKAVMARQAMINAYGRGGGGYGGYSGMCPGYGRYH